MFRASRHGIERLEICDKEDDKNPKIITLENCVKITQEPAPSNQINIVTKTETLTLNALNEAELKHWVQALQSVAFKDKSGTLSRNSVIEEDNDLYCTSYSDGIFNVKLLATDTAHLKCKLEPKSYILHLTTTEIQLKDIDDNGIVAKWPYRYVRKYGYRDGKFTFEAGRKCDTGEGEFSLHHANPQEVFRCMAAKMKSMKKLISGENMASLDCGEHQFNAALSMEAGSRSPLPPSPNHQPIQSDSELSQSGSHLIRGILSSTDSLNNLSMSSTSTTASILKNIPNKPPRKSVPMADINLDNKPLRNEDNIRPTMVGKTPAQQLKFLKQASYEPVSMLKSTHLGPSSSLPTSPVSGIPSSGSTSKTLLLASTIINDINDQPPQLPQRNESMGSLDERNYERIETITNAWRTMGVDDVKHTEHVTTPEDELAEFVWKRSQSQKDADRFKKPIVIDDSTKPMAKIDPEDNYDKLQFFASKGTGGSSDYKTIVMVNSPGYRKQVSQPVTSNDYEIIGECGTGTSLAGTPTSTPPSLPTMLTSSDIHQSYRLADDSYMGYGVLRKTTSIPPSPSSASPISPKSNTTIATATSPTSPTAVTVSSSNELLDHRKYNGLDYAIVSKPKRV